MPTLRGLRLLGSNSLPSHFLLLCGLAATWSPTSALAEDAEWLWQNPQPVGPSCDVGIGHAAISFLQSDPEVAMAVRCGSTVLRTTDGGDTWIDAAGNLESDHYGFGGVSVIDMHTAVVVGVRFRTPAILRTADGGATWSEQQPAVLPTLGALESVHFLDSLSGLAVGYSLQPLFQPIVIRTHDAGGTWEAAEELDTPPIAVLSGLSCVDSDTCIAVGGGGKSIPDAGPLVLRTLDGGATWDTRLSGTGLPQQLIDVDCQVTGTCYAVGSGGTVFKSVDDGGSWTQQVSGTTAALADVSCRSDIVCLAVGDVNVHDRRVLLRTDDGGATWSTVIDEVNTILVAVAFHGTSAEATAISEIRGGFLRSSDGGATWDRHPQFRDHLADGYVVSGRSQLAAVEFVNPAIGMVVGRRDVDGEAGSEGLELRGVLMRTADGGNTWQDLSPWLPVPSDRPPSFKDIEFVDADTGFVVGNVYPSPGSGGAGGVVALKSEDGGASWTSLPLPPEYQGTRFAFAGVGFFDEDRGALVGGRLGSISSDADGVILHTADGGMTWSSWTTPAESGDYFYDVDFVSPNVGVVVGRLGKILRTVDGGVTWTEQASGTSARLRAVAFSDAGEGWVVGENTVLHTTDGGVTWLDAVPDALPGDFYIWDIEFDDDQHGMMVGEVSDVRRPQGARATHGVVLSTTDGGDSWHLEGGKPSRVQRHLGVAYLGDGIWSTVGVLESSSAVGGGADKLGGFVFQRRQDETFLPLSPSPSASTLCLPPDGVEVESAIYVGVGSVAGYGGTVQLSTSGEPEGVSSVLEPPSVNAPGSTTWMLTVDGSVSPGQHLITLQGDDGEQQHFAKFVLNVVGSGQVPLPVAPANGEADVDLQPTFTWDAVRGVYQYRIQVAADPAFGDIVIDEEVSGVFFTPAAELDSLTQYFWRVQGIYECLDDAWSDVFSFTTETQPQAQVSPSALAFEVPLGSEDEAALEIANVGTGDLVWSIEVELLPGGEGCAEGSWLSAAPDSGSTPAGGSTPVTVSVDTSGLEVCDYSAQLHVATNDADHASIAVPVSLTVTGSDLEFDPQSVDFGEVEAGHAGAPAIVTLHSVGALDATGLEFQLPGTEFDVNTSACGTTLPIGGQCAILVVFTPPGVGPFSGTLEVHSDDGAIAFVSLTGHGVPETGIFVPVGMEVDTEPIISDANGVFEPGELAPVAPIWLNDGLFAQFLEGTASDLNGPEGPDYTLLAADADYGEVETGEMARCQESGLCYEMDIGPSGVTRPAPHWDATFDEALSDETTQTWTLHLGDSFVDVPRSNLFYRPVETLLHSGITGGCTEGAYCPAGRNSRAQMAVFLLRAVEGEGYTPQPCVAGEERFLDVPAGSTFCPWIEELAARGVTSGCGGDNYCPADSVTRAQMAVFLLKAVEGDDFVPPPCTGTFSDVECPSTFAAWIEELAARGITGGCSETEYCPATPVTRAQMASFVTEAFGLELYGP